MLQSLNKLLLDHASLLLLRKWKKSILQLLPSIMFTFLFAQIYYLTTKGTNDKSYIWVYFFLSLILVLFISTVIYYRESTLELNSLYYLILLGFRKIDVWLIVIFKWIILFLFGFVLAISLFFFYNLHNILQNEIKIIGSVLYSAFFLNLLLLIGIIIAIINFYKYK